MNTLVVARHTEDTEWTTSLPPGWQAAIVQKGEDLPNEGREGGSFLWWIARNYPRIRRTSLYALYAFVQGDPFPHCPDLHALLSAAPARFTWLGDTSYESDHNGAPNHGGLPVGRKHRQWTGRDMGQTVRFAAGGQFVLPGRLILRHPRRYYHDLYAESVVGDAPWVLERLWEAIFTTTRET